MLIGGTHTFLKSPMTQRGGVGLSGMRNAFYQTGRLRNAALTPDGSQELRGLPQAYGTSGYSWPRTAGSIASYARASGTGAINPLAMAQGMALDSTLTGQGDITEAFAGLIVSALATLTGQGDITSADAKAYLNAMATLSGSGDIQATSVLSALGWIESMVSGSGTASGISYATGELGAVIRGYSDLTPEGIRDKVWTALAASFNEAGTLGNKLNTASSGGVDLNALAAAVWSYVSRTLTAGGSGATPEEIAAAILAAAQITPIHSDMRKAVGQAYHGDGSEGNKLRSTLVP